MYVWHSVSTVNPCMVYGFPVTSLFGLIVFLDYDREHQVWLRNICKPSAVCVLRQLICCCWDGSSGCHTLNTARKLYTLLSHD